MVGDDGKPKKKNKKKMGEPSDVNHPLWTPVNDSGPPLGHGGNKMREKIREMRMAEIDRKEQCCAHNFCEKKHLDHNRKKLVQGEVEVC